MAKSAQAALLDGRFRQARDLARAARNADPTLVEALLIEATAYSHLGEFDAAIDLYDQVSAGGEPEVEARFMAADLAFSRGRFADAERRFRQVLSLSPGHAEANRRLSALLSAQNRRWESLPYLLALLRLKSFIVADLILLSVPDQIKNDERLIRAARQLAPEDPTPLLGLAAKYIQDGNLGTAAELLDQVLQAAPDMVEAHVRRGLLLPEAAPAEVAKWEAGLPANAGTHPDIWRLRGMHAAARGETATAMRCFWEAVRLHPNDRSACSRLAQLLAEAGRDREALPFQERAKNLDALARDVQNLQSEGPSFDAALNIARRMDALGRLWEAWAWRKLALSKPGIELDRPAEVAAVRDEIARLEPRLTAATPITLAESNPASLVDLASLPLPGGVAAPTVEPDVAPSDGADLATVRWVDQASAAGLVFRCNNGDDMSVPGMQIFNELGGGIAAIDYDLDGWPDLYLSQGCDWPPDPAQREDLDRLYRNFGNGRAVDVTAAAGLGDEGFSQGATFGDYNADGFPDLYVGNIGRNRLYRNNGDGTFTDVTDEAGLPRDPRWTTSVMLADLNGDALPEIVDLTYIAGQECYTTFCPDGERVRACRPGKFAADQDRLQLNLGDGRFEDITEAAGIFAKDGKGLGLVAADFEGQGQLSLFVANDETPNFFFLNQTAARGGRPLFREAASGANLALDGEGRSQACMGVAAGDVDNDGHCDLFVTNFYQESNTLYLQSKSQRGRFADVTNRAGLRQSSLAMLGFGTQFLDADLDGWLDIVVANGHVDDFSHLGSPYKMRPQFYRNRGRIRGAWKGFAELHAPELGPYFGGEFLGRSLARLDWNRDGRDDFAVMHLDAPLALAVNATQGAGRSISLRLRGVQSSREAIGAVVTVQAGQATAVYRVFGGDGFQAANERKLVIGLGGAAKIDALTVHWPAGGEQTFRNVVVDREYTCVEGRAELAPAP